MAKVRFTRRAREDLFEIWAYITEHANLHTADLVYKKLEDHCEILCAHPLIGRARPEIGPDARSIIVECWVALYRTVDMDVQIVRVIDGVRDISKIEWVPE